jgi:hypothetical protein
MKHKHAELIHAWADGAEIQIKTVYYDKVWLDDLNPSWGEHSEYRIKPEPKPDVIDYACVTKHAINNFMPNIEWTVKKWANLKLIFDGETGKLKSAEVVE